MNAAGSVGVSAEKGNDNNKKGNVIGLRLKSDWMTTRRSNDKNSSELRGSDREPPERN